MNFVSKPLRFLFIISHPVHFLVRTVIEPPKLATARVTTSNHDGQEVVQSGISELAFENRVHSQIPCDDRL